MSKSMSRVILDTDRKVWEQGIRDATVRIAKLRQSIKIFKENIRQGVKVPTGVKSSATHN